MAAVAAGGDRQQLHERIRRHSMDAAKAVKTEGKPNDLLDRLTGDAAFAATDLRSVMDPARFVGRAPQQVEQFVQRVVGPVRARYRQSLEQRVELKV